MAVLFVTASRADDLRTLSVRIRLRSCATRLSTSLGRFSDDGLDFLIFDLDLDLALGSGLSDFSGDRLVRVLAPDRPLAWALLLFWFFILDTDQRLGSHFFINVIH